MMFYIECKTAEEVDKETEFVSNELMKRIPIRKEIIRKVFTEKKGKRLREDDVGVVGVFGADFSLRYGELVPETCFNGNTNDFEVVLDRLRKAVKAGKLKDK